MFACEHGGKRDQNARDQSGHVAAEQACEKAAFEAQVGRLIAGQNHADGHACSEDDGQPKGKSQPLIQGAGFQHQHGLELAGPRQNAGDRSHYAEFQQQGYQVALTMPCSTISYRKPL